MLLGYIAIGAITMAIVNSVLGIQYTANSSVALLVSKGLYLAFGMGLGFLLRHLGWL